MQDADPAAEPRAHGARDPLHVERALEQIATLLGFSGTEAWKARAYQQGARIVAALGERVGVLVSEGRLREVPGVGASLSRQIEELWNSGSSSLLRQLEQRYPPGAALLAGVPGLRLRRIRVLHEALGISSIAQLRAAIDADQIQKLPGFGKKSSQKLASAIERLTASDTQPIRPLRKRLLLADALELAAQLERTLLESGAASAVKLGGAARRGEELVSELELLVVTDEPASVWSELRGLRNVIVIDAARGEAQLVAGVPLCLHFTDPQHAAARWLLATGSTPHVEALIARARHADLALNADGLFDRSGVLHPCASEFELYRALGLHYVPPELRTDASVLGSAEMSDFADLIQASDVLGMIHCHTTYSDGKDTIEAMARAAERMGMQYITITDHSPTAHYAGGVDLDKLKQQWDEIAEVQERVKIRILRGTESDILADGSLDYPDAILEQLDVIIASIHARWKMDTSAMTKRLTRAMQLPLFKIWGHALGRLLMHREPFACDVLRVLDALAESRGAVEINSDPQRLDLAPEWLVHARQRKLRFVISVDAHSTRGLDVYPLGVTMARRAGVRRGEVLNTLDASEFARSVRPLQTPAA